MTAEQQPRITRDDIENKFRELQGEVETATDDVRSYAATVGAVLAVIALLLAFLLGRNRAKRTRTVVEIRRF
jgi:hypothetical protein